MTFYRYYSEEDGHDVLTDLAEMGLYWPKPADEWEAQRRAARGYRPRQEEPSGAEVPALDLPEPSGRRWEIQEGQDARPGLTMCVLQLYHATGRRVRHGR